MDSATDSFHYKIFPDQQDWEVTFDIGVVTCDREGDTRIFIRSAVVDVLVVIVVSVVLALF